MIGHQTHNPALVEAILNHPSVRPTIDRETEGRLSATDLVNNPNVVCYASPTGLCLFGHRGDGEWQGHVAIIAGARGVQSVKFAREALAYLFEVHQARRCLAAIPLDLPQAAVFVKQLGFKRARLDPVAGIEHLVKECE